MYNLNTEKGRKIKMICIRMKIKIKEILPEQYLEPVGYLAGIEGIEPNGRIYEGTGFDEEMLLMKGFDKRIFKKQNRTCRPESGFDAGKCKVVFTRII